MNKKILLFANLFFAYHAIAGISVTSVTKTESSPKEASKPVTMNMHVEGQSMRIDWVGGKNPTGRDGYLLSTDGGQTLFLVDPSDKTYMRWDMDQMMQLAGGAMEAMKGFMQFNVLENKIEKVADEPGPSIIGYPTRYYKFITTTTTEMTMLGRKQTNKTVVEQEIWATTKIQMPAMDMWKKLQAQKTGFESMDKLLEAEKAKEIKGFPLKTIVVSSDGQGKKSVTITEVTEIKEGKLDGALFKIPQDYKEEKLDMPDEAGSTSPSKSGTGDAPSPVDIFMKSFNRSKR